MGQKRRVHERTEINITTRITYKPVSGSDTKELLGKTRDLSIGGAMITLPDLTEIDEIVSVDFRIPDLSSRVSTEAEIKWTSEEPDEDFIGIQFTSLSSDEREGLRKYLKRNETQGLTQKASPVRFKQLIEHLIVEFDLSNREGNQLEETPPNRLYEMGKMVGIQPYELAEFIAKHLDLTYVPSLSKNDVELEDLSQAFCIQNNLVPIRNENGKRSLVLSNPYSHVCHSIIKRYFQSEIDEYLITEPRNIEHVFLEDAEEEEEDSKKERYQTSSGLFILNAEDSRKNIKDQLDDLSVSDEFDDLDQEREESEKENVVRIVNKLLTSAIKEGVSDIHIEPRSEKLLVRYRIDGVLNQKWQLPKSLARVLITRIKIMSDMDIAERRTPQDGGFSVLFNNRRVDVRASIIPVNTGEKAVLRVLDKRNIPDNLEGLGFDETSVKQLRQSLSHTKGILYFTGPTGSGKTTTMYTCLQKLSTPEVNIQTVENPIEYNIPEVNQMEVNHKADLTFAKALRGILRQDPDVLMVGEIRDRETLDMAAKASMSGHLVLSTLHTNDAASTVERLLNIGLDAYTIATTTQIIVAQRLMRLLCENCKTAVDDPELYVEMYPTLKEKDPQLFEPIGCKKCNQTGYQGRTGVMECLIPSESVRNAIREGKGTDVLRNIMTEEQGLNTLRMNAFQKVADGVTSVEEAIRVSMV